MKKLMTTGLTVAAALMGSAAMSHPLDGLTGAEITRTTEILREAGEATEETLYPLIELKEPPKDQVLAWQEGDELDRRVIVDFATPEGFKRATVNLTQGTVEESAPTEGQPMVLFGEFMKAMEVALSDERMVAGLEARGVTPEEAFCLPLTAGNFLTPEYEGKRLMKVPCYKAPSGTSNWYAKPLEGLYAMVDLQNSEVVEVIDEGALPAPEDDWGYTEAEIAERAPLRPASNPATLSQEGGPNYTIENGVVNWDIWRFRYRTDKRPGLVLSNIDVRDGEEWRSVLYQAHLSEVFVPYMDPSEGWYWRTYMDSGEYGFGLFLTPLRKNVDCPSYATFLPAVVNDDAGNPMEIPDAVCVFERNIGDPAWRHFEVFEQGPDKFVPAEGRPETELVIRTASEVGNYDYLIDYRFKENGAIYIMIGASGLDAVKGVASTSMDDETAEADTRYGSLIAPNLVAPNHDHYFNFRLDFDVDQPSNMASTLDIVPAEDLPTDVPRKSMWQVNEVMADSELTARYTFSAFKPRYFHVMDSSKKGPLGHSPAYMIHHGNVAYGPYDFENDPPFKRNRYLEYSLWNTVYDPDQRYAGGTFAMQSDGSDTLAQWVEDDQSLHNADIVSWFTAGFHHIPRIEDWPVMSTEWKTIHLMPMNFFAMNPAATIRLPADDPAALPVDGAEAETNAEAAEATEAENAATPEAEADAATEAEPEAATEAEAEAQAESTPEADAVAEAESATEEAPAEQAVEAEAPAEDATEESAPTEQSEAEEAAAAIGEATDEASDVLNDALEDALGEAESIRDAVDGAVSDLPPVPKPTQ